MNACMQDTFNLGWKLAMVIKGLMSSEHLDTYQTERMPVAQQVVEGTNDMHQIIMAHGEELSDRAELTKREGWHERAVAKISGLGYTYEESQSLPEGLSILPGPTIGSRAHDVTLHDRQRLFEMTAHPRMTLLVICQEDDEPVANDLIQDVDMKYGQAIKSYIVKKEPVYGQNQDFYYQDVSGDLFLDYGHEEKSCILFLRPDGYIGFRCLLSEKSYLEDYLGSFLLQEGIAA